MVKECGTGRDEMGEIGRDGVGECGGLVSITSRAKRNDERRNMEEKGGSRTEIHLVPGQLGCVLGEFQ